MRVMESFEGNKVIRRWYCCGHKWQKTFEFSDLEAASWTPVCPKCEGWDESQYV